MYTKNVDSVESLTFGSILASNVEAELPQTNTTNNENVNDSNPTIEEDVYEFSIYIPKIGLKKNIIPYVSPVEESEYLDVIEKNVAHGKYTFTPERTNKLNWGITYLFAHREGNSGFFNRLGELNTGDRIEINFNGKKYIYSLTSKYIVDPSQTEVYSSYHPTPLLRIQTCENGLSQRLIVDSALISVE
ncbi:MAG: sortase [Ignavibacteriae bacterium]|nr:sortase [Ignavibacteriota bacterium]